LSRAILFGGAAAIAALFLSVLIIIGQMIVYPWLSSQNSQPHSERPLDQPTAG
jgi:hypothetical protein